MKQKIILIGGGGHCKSVIDVIEQEDKYEIAGIVDLKEKNGQNILGYPIIASDEDLPELVKEYTNFHITMGFIKNPTRRKQILEILKKTKAVLPVIVSPIAYVSKHARIAAGTVIMHNAQVNAGATIGENCIINSRALIEHDAIVGDNCHISTGAIINGHVIVGNECFVGSGAVTVQGTKIPDGSFIKANSLFISR